MLQDFHISMSAPLIISKVGKITGGLAPVEVCFKVFKDVIEFATQSKERKKEKNTKRNKTSSPKG